MKGANVIRSELIGLPIKVVKARNRSNNSIEGKIVDETKNAFVVEDENGRKRMLLKEGCVFDIGAGKTAVRIDGSILANRPEERVKMQLR